METLVGELVRYKRQSQSLFAALRGELGSLDDSIPAAKRMTSTSSQAMPAHIGDQDGLEMRIEQLEATLKTCMDGIGNKAVGSTAPTSNVSEPATNAERIKKLEVTMVRMSFIPHRTHLTAFHRSAWSSTARRQNQRRAKSN